MGGLQETKWFGEKIYIVGNSIVLTSGREVPRDVVVKQRGEGVALVLMGLAIKAWTSGGSQWKTWNYRII